MSSENLLGLLNSTTRYFMQQQDLFGNVIYMDQKTVPDKQSVNSKFQYPENETWVESASLESLNVGISSCMKCPLGHTRTKLVFGVGNSTADVMFVGEAPGADEDAKGEPFVGRAGQLLNKILDAVNLKRDEVYICNILKCRPPNNRDPELIEMQTCTPHLYKQIELIKPKFIICLGRIAGQWLLQTKDTLTSLRGKIHDYNGIKMIVTYHPAALLRNPNWKYPAWEDMKMFRVEYDKMKAS